MPSTETYYLIDFENVNEDGLSGAEQLGSHDHVHIFSTKNAPKISIEKLAALNNADLSAHEVPASSQSLDMHLVSYLGYLIGTSDQNCKYVIVSRDTDYDNIIDFWKEAKKASITRRPEIAKSKKETKSGDNKTSVSINLNSEIQKRLSNSGYANDIVNHVASLACKCHNEPNAKQTIYRSIISEYGQKDGLNIYNHIKKLL